MEAYLVGSRKGVKARVVGGQMEDSEGAGVVGGRPPCMFRRPEEIHKAF